MAMPSLGTMKLACSGAQVSWVREMPPQVVISSMRATNLSRIRRISPTPEASHTLSSDLTVWSTWVA